MKYTDAYRIYVLDKVPPGAEGLERVLYDWLEDYCDDRRHAPDPKIATVYSILSKYAGFDRRITVLNALTELPGQLVCDGQRVYGEYGTFSNSAGGTEYTGVGLYYHETSQLWYIAYYWGSYADRSVLELRFGTDEDLVV